MKFSSEWLLCLAPSSPSPAPVAMVPRQEIQYMGRTTRVSGAAVSRPLDPLVMRFINKEELMTGNEDLTVQFGEDPPWDDLPPVDREKAGQIIAGLVGRQPAEVREMIMARLAAAYVRRTG